MILVFVLAIMTEVAREVCFKLAAMRPVPQGKRYLAGVLASPLTLAGFALAGVHIFSWLKVLSYWPLSVAFPIKSICYCGIPLASWLFLKERLTRYQLAGAAMIAAGVALIGATGL